MKIRTGFVSNSSAASFTIIWQILSDDKNYSSNEAIDALFDFDGRQEIMDDIKKNTKSLVNNTFETNFFTVMFNSFGDFGSGAEALLFHLYGRNLTDRCDPSTVILKSQIKSEGGW